MTVAGEGAGEAPAGPDNLFLRAFVAAGGDPAGLSFDMHNEVPFARGLGSSAATIVAGLVAADAWHDRPPRDLLGLATELEGHPDNVAAALNGGLTLAWTGSGGVSAIGFGVPEAGFVTVVPEQRLSTAAGAGGAARPGAARGRRAHGRARGPAGGRVGVRGCRSAPRRARRPPARALPGAAGAAAGGGA